MLWNPPIGMLWNQHEKHLNCPIWIGRPRNGFLGTVHERLHGAARVVVIKNRIGD